MLLLPFLLVADPKVDVAKLPPAADRVVDYAKDIEPILSTHCFGCHGAEKQKGGLRLDDARSALAGGNSGAVIISKKSAESPLIHAVARLVSDSAMPPDEKKKLSNEQIGLLRAWIDQGAVMSNSGVSIKQKKSDHWAFQPLKPVEGSVDFHIRQRLKKERLAPSPRAENLTLLRRAHLDITGLPPTLEEIAAFEKDPNFEKLVDRLLASPHFGERWGRHWLDNARYADSDGYEKDTGRPYAWRYRDWVIDALNRNMPFDAFTIQQLAGDQIPNADAASRTATGFHRNTLTNREGGVDAEEFRVAAVVDRVNTTATVWLGLTIGCCQCHDHKYDPLSQREYYQFAAYFNSDKESDIDVPLPGEVEKIKAERAAHAAAGMKLKIAIDEARDLQLAKDEVTKREKSLADHEKKVPKPSKVQTLELGSPRKTHVHIRGDFLRKGVEVQSGTPSVLPSIDAKSRLELANWIVSKENPLTPRVTVNWVWGKLFGRGLVATPEDFGTQGQKPSHPELLDTLAADFRSDWNVKRLIKRIMLSETYQQSTTITKTMKEIDPQNVLLARQSRLRLEAEIVRDNALAAAGLLTRTVGGPSIRPPQPAGISELTYAGSAKWTESTGAEKYKRGMYIWFQRTSPYPTLMTFDEPDSNVCTVRRERSNTALQALTLLNDKVFLEAAQAMAKRVWEEKDCDRIELMMRLAIARPPTKAERELLLKLLRESSERLSADPATAKQLLGAYVHEKTPNAAVWVAVARVILNLDEFVTRE